MIFRKCIRITAKDSPNVEFALWQISQGIPPTGEQIIPGVLSWEAYNFRLATFSQQRRTESLEASWYEGAEERLIPDEWLQFANEHAKKLDRRRNGRKWLGVDPGEGGDDSSWCVGDRLGVLGITSLKTPDTNSVYGRTCLLVREHGIAWEDVIFDYGGGGKEHVDRFRAAGFMVRGLRFGAIKKELKRGMTQFTERREVEEDTASYVNRRSEMAYSLRVLLERPTEISDPTVIEAMQRMGNKKIEKDPYALPVECCGAYNSGPDTLCGQLRAVPLRWDDQGRFKLIPKSPPQGQPEHQDNFKSRIGRSPDQFDAFCLMVYGMLNPPPQSRAGTS